MRLLRRIWALPLLLGVVVASTATAQVTAQNLEPPEGIVFRDPLLSRDGVPIRLDVAPPDSIVFREPFIRRDGQVIDPQVFPPRGVILRDPFINREGQVLNPNVLPPQGLVFREPFLNRDGTVRIEDLPPPDGLVFRDPFIRRNGTVATSAPPGLSTLPLVLQSVMPNPFNPNAQISFRLNEPADVVVEVFDVQGRLVRRIDAGPLNADLHVLRWNGNDDRGHSVGSGVYLFRVRAGEHSASTKAALVK